MKSKNQNKSPKVKNDIYRRNMAALKKHYPDLARAVKGVPVGRGYEIIHTGPGRHPTLRAVEQDMLYYDPADPLQDVQGQLALLDLKNTRLAVVLGVGLGYEALLFTGNIAPGQGTNYVLVIEKDPEIFKAALLTTDLVSLITSPSFHFMVGIPEGDMYVEMRKYLSDKSRFMLLGAASPVYHMSALQLNGDYYLKVLMSLKEAGFHQVLNFGNCPTDSLVGVENMLDNLGEITGNPGINLLFNKFRGRPAVIVSTGPSLDKNKHLLRGLEGRALVIAPDASLKVLLDMGVKPHLVTSLERLRVASRCFEGLAAEEVQDVYLAACPVIYNEVYGAYPGPRVIVYRNFDHFKWLGVDRGILDIMISSGNMAFKVAAALGCDPIILVGQDLAFDRGGKSHAAGNVYGERQEMYYKGKPISVKGNDGDPIDTTHIWYQALKAYEMDVAEYGGTCINSTEGGAYIPGTRVMPLQESLEKYARKTFDPLGIIKGALGVFSPDHAEEDARGVSRLIEKTMSDLEGITGHCRAGLQALEVHGEELESLKGKPSTDDRDKRRVAELEEIVLSPKRACHTDYHHTYQLFFMHIFQSFSIKFDMQALGIPGGHTSREAARAEILLRHGEWYRVAAGMAGICLDLLARAKGRVADRNPRTLKPWEGDDMDEKRN